MKRTRHRRIALLFGALLVTLIAVPVVTTWRQVRQDLLDRSLIAAVKANNMRQLQHLLAQGADVNARDTVMAPLSLWRVFLNGLHGHEAEGNRSSTALCVAIANGCDTAIVQTLLDHGADPNGQDADGQTALWVALDTSATSGFDLVTPLLIHYHANVNSLRPGSEGRTLLMNAAGWGDEEDINRLVHAGAQINARDSDGETALIYAVDDCRPDTVLPLLKHHADPNVKARDGRTALETAESNLAAHANTPFNHEDHGEGWREIVRLLKAAGAKK